MHKLRHKHTKLIKSLALVAVLVSVIAGLLAATPKTAFAASFYQTDQSADCNANDLRVDSPPVQRFW